MISSHKDHTNKRIDEVILKPATWQYDRYQRALDDLYADMLEIIGPTPSLYLDEEAGLEIAELQATQRQALHSYIYGEDK